MTITHTKDENKLTLSVGGRLDTNAALELEEVIKNNIEGVTELTFDFNGLDYISSAGLRILLSTQKTMNSQGTMKFINVHESIMLIFDITGFKEILTIE